MHRPPEVEAYELTGLIDQNGVEIYKPLLHSCGAESVNAAQQEFVSTHTAGKEYATGCMLQGNAKRIISQQVALGQHENLGTWDTRAAQRINRWAGHKDDANMIRLTAVAPHAVPTLKPSNELVIHKLERLDSRCNRLIPTDATLQSTPGTPIAIGCLPPRNLLALPSLTSTVRAPASALTLSSNNFIDPQQMDSPMSKRALDAFGINDPSKASPGMLRRCIDWVGSKIGVTSERCACHYHPHLASIQSP